MADELHLNEDESIVDRIGKIGYGGFWSGNNDLVLTNKSIILVKKGLFGDVQEVVRFPLSDLRVVGGEVQAKVGHPDNMTHTLDLYFDKGVESFRFEWESDAQKWADKITEVITGVKVERCGGISVRLPPVCANSFRIREASSWRKGRKRTACASTC